MQPWRAKLLVRFLEPNQVQVDLTEEAIKLRPRASRPSLLDTIQKSAPRFGPRKEGKSMEINGNLGRFGGAPCDFHAGTGQKKHRITMKQSRGPRELVRVVELWR